MSCAVAFAVIFAGIFTCIDAQSDSSINGKSTVFLSFLFMALVSAVLSEWGSYEMW